METQNRGCSIGDNRHGASSIFGHMAIFIKMFKSITKFYPSSEPLGVSLIMPSLGDIMTLTCTVFSPTYFGSILKNHVFHIPPTRIKKSIMGTTRLLLYNRIQVSHRLSQGQELVCLSPEERYKFLVPA